MKKYIELKESTDYDLITNEYNNNYGYNINGKEHSSLKTPEEHLSPYNIVNEDSFLKKR